MEISGKSSIELMNLYARILYELNHRGVVRTYNSPVGDYAEWLVAEKMGLKLEANSKKGYDAYHISTGARYQIKSRWERGKACLQSRELNVIRNYEEHQFDDLIAIIFGADFSVKAAYSIPHETIGKYARYSKHQNGYILVVMGPVLEDSDVIDITEKFH